MKPGIYAPVPRERIRRRVQASVREISTRTLQGLHEDWQFPCRAADFAFNMELRITERSTQKVWLRMGFYS